MLQKSITYVNPFTDQEVTETFYFHLSAADLMELEVSEHGGLKEKLQRIIASEDNREILETFKQIISKSYGKREDGKFIKNPELAAEFAASEAYSALLLEFMGDPEGAAAFINGLTSKGLETDLDKVREKQQIGGAMGKPRTPAEAAALEKQRTSEDLGQPKPGSGEIVVQTPVDGATENVFDADNPKILTPAEVVEMDADELKSGLATGKYKLQ